LKFKNYSAVSEKLESLCGKMQYINSWETFMPKKFTSTLGFIFERSLPWLVLAILVAYTYAKFFVVPHPGFDFSDGKINLIHISTPDNQLMIGDQLVQVGPMDMAEFAADPKLVLFENVQVGDAVPIVFERDGEVKSIDWEYVGQNRAALLEDINGLWWIPYVFWLAGTAALLFIRPRDLRWKLLIAFNFLTAIWFAAGSGPSRWHVWHSMFVLRAGVWFCVPVYLHFHWVFPRPLRQLPKIVWIILYAAGLLLAAAEWLNLLPLSAYFSGFLLSLVGSLVLLGLHFIFQPEQRPNLRLLILAVGIILIPPIGIGLFEFLGINLPASQAGGTLLAFPALPGAYFITSIRAQFPTLKDRIRQFIRNYVIAILITTLLIIGLTVFIAQFPWQDSSLGIGLAIIPILAILAIFSLLPFFAIPALAASTYQPGPVDGQLQLRANRILASFTFLILVGAGLTLGAAIVFHYAGNDIYKIMGGIGAIFAAILLSVYGFPGYRRFVERRILGIKLPPAGMVATYADRIITRLNRTDLAQLLQDEILPSLLIRQAALVPLEKDEPEAPIFKLGVSADEVNLALENSPPSWVQVDLPLTIQERTIGRLLLGTKDPDDVYSQAEVAVLQAIANQTAIALHNIQQNERLQSIYQGNLDRHEEERKQLAHDLHDEVLNGLASLLMFVDLETAAPNYREEHTALTTRIRRMISGLRPARLDDGLWAALDTLVDELGERGADQIGIHFNIPETAQRYETSIEGHLYRIVQQACDNALQHADPHNIYISGELLPDTVTIQVRDDGKGFDPANIEQPQDQTGPKHYGLAVMRDRAETIGANYELTSFLDEGTQITLKFADILRRTEERAARMKAEESLLAREKNFQDLVEHATYGILMADQNHKIIYANPQAAEITGYSVPELTAQHIIDLAQPSEYAKMQTWNATREREQPISARIETSIRHQDGREIPVDMMIAHTLWRGEPVGMTLFQDISLQRETTLALMEIEGNFKAVVENAQDGIVIVDSIGKHLYVNQAFAEMSGYEREELQQLGMTDMVHPADLAKMSNRLEKRSAGEPAESFAELNLVKKSGEVMLVEAIGAPVQWQGQAASLGIMRDITYRKHAEIELRNSEENLRNVIENTNDGIIIASTDNQFVYTNQSMANMVGYGQDEILAIKIQDLVHPDEYETVYSRFRDRLAGEEVVSQYEITLVTKEGEPIPTEVTGNRIVWQGQPAVLGIFRDITARKTAEEQRFKNERDLRNVMDAAQDGILIAFTNQYLRQKGG